MTDLKQILEDLKHELAYAHHDLEPTKGLIDKCESQIKAWIEENVIAVRVINHAGCAVGGKTHSKECETQSKLQAKQRNRLNTQNKAKSSDWIDKDSANYILNDISKRKGLHQSDFVNFIVTEAELEPYLREMVTMTRVNEIDNVVHTLVFEGLNLTDEQVTSLTELKEQLLAQLQSQRQQLREEK